MLHTSNINVKFYQNLVHSPATIDFKPITMHNTFFSYSIKSLYFSNTQTYLQVNNSTHWPKHLTKVAADTNREKEWHVQIEGSWHDLIELS